jgi:hypothetical protein
MNICKVKVNLVDGHASTDQHGKVTLDQDNGLEIKIGKGFKHHARVSAMTLYRWDENRRRGQGERIGAWERSNPHSQPSPALYITYGKHHIGVTDVDPDDDARFCYTVTVSDRKGDHTTPDPELIVKKRN